MTSKITWVIYILCIIFNRDVNDTPILWFYGLNYYPTLRLFDASTTIPADCGNTEIQTDNFSAFAVILEAIALAMAKI